MEGDGWDINFAPVSQLRPNLAETPAGRKEPQKVAALNKNYHLQVLITREIKIYEMSQKS